jgi:hypothetical protein
MGYALRDHLAALHQHPDDGLDVDSAPQTAPDPRSLSERLAQGSADDVEAALRRIHVQHNVESHWPALPELPRPLKNWGAPWLVRDILAARDQRLAGH